MSGQIMGLTVAVAVKGRIVLSQGYGFAERNGVQSDSPSSVEMQRNTRAPIGSSGKALMSGPSVWEILTDQEKDPVEYKLYAPEGIRSGYGGDRRVGIRRLGHIAAMAIAPDDDVYAWTRDGRVSRGSSRNLTIADAPRSYRAADGKTYRDIRAIAISGGRFQGLCLV